MSSSSTLSNSSPPSTPGGRPRSRSLSDSKDLAPRRKRTKRTVDLITRAGKHAARTIQINFQTVDILQHGIDIQTQKTTGEIASLPTDSDKKFNIFTGLMKLIPDAKQKLLGDNGHEYLINLASSIDKGLSGARSDDTNGLKKAIIEFLGECSPPIPRNQKARRGMNHPTTAKLLCPIKYDISDPSVRKKLQDGAIKPAPTDCPPFLYENYEIERGNTFKGLFRSELLINAAKHVLTSPSSADSNDTASRATRHGNAALNGMTRITRPAIAYIATQVRFALSSDEVFGQTSKGAFDVYAFYANLLRLLNLPQIEDKVEELEAFWNLEIFGNSEDSDAPADDPDSAIAMILAEAQEAEAEAEDA